MSITTVQHATADSQERPAGLRDVFALRAAGRTTVIRETRPLDDVNEAIAGVEAGRVAARIVLQP